MFYILNEITTNSMNAAVLNVFSTLSILAGVFVIISRNPIVSVLFLIGLFFCIANYLITIGLTFIGLSYLLVYVGAVSILFLFILMLINIRISELYSETNNSIPLVLFIGVSLVTIILSILPKEKNYSVYDLINYDNSSLFSYNNSINLVNSSNWDINLYENSHISSIGNVMYTNYFIGSSNYFYKGILRHLALIK